MVTLSYGPEYLAGPLGLPVIDPEDDDVVIPAWQSWGITALFFTPGLIVGLVIGWFSIKPVNAVLGAFFRGFNRGFDFMTGIYGWIIGNLLRLSAIVLIAYCGLLFMTYTVFRDAPRGFVPQQDMGRLIVSVQLPDSSGLARTEIQWFAGDKPPVHHAKEPLDLREADSL
jgi:multidrug efflux pump